MVGYPIGPDQALPVRLSELLGGRLVGQVAYLQFARLPEHLRLIDRLRTSHALLQLGNHEFVDHFRPLLRQLREVLWL